MAGGPSQWGGPKIGLLGRIQPWNLGMAEGTSRRRSQGPSGGWGLERRYGWGLVSEGEVVVGRWAQVQAGASSLGCGRQVKDSGFHFRSGEKRWRILIT